MKGNRPVAQCKGRYPTTKSRNPTFNRDQLIALLKESPTRCDGGIDVVLQSASGVRYCIDSIDYDSDTDEILINVGDVHP